jgi:hypothetical protein
MTNRAQYKPSNCRAAMRCSFRTQASGRAYLDGEGPEKIVFRIFGANMAPALPVQANYLQA